METLIFYVNSVKVEDVSVDPRQTLLQYLRLKLKLCGTKLGCAEGGCGACTVMISTYDRTIKRIRHYSINACLMPICAVHGVAVTTVEGIGSIRTRLHPIQERLAKNYGSQCGFCTPGIVMSMYTLLRNNDLPSFEEIETYMQGNLCRCTGYRPILQAFKTFTQTGKETNGWTCCQQMNGSNNTCGKETKCCQSTDFDTEDTHYAPYDPSQEPIFPPELIISDALDKKLVKFETENLCWYRPVTYQQILELKNNNPEAKIVVGNSEIGVETKFKNFVYPMMITAILIPEMNYFKVEEDGILIGAALTLSSFNAKIDELIETLPECKTRCLKAISKMLNLFAGMQIRNAASIAGNIMTASPISDLNPLLMAAGAILTVSTPDTERKVKMNGSFFTGYRKTVIKDSELLTSIFIPFTREDEYFYGYKQARRREDDIAIVNAGMRVKFTHNTSTISEISLAYGGMAPTTVFAKSTMANLVNRNWDEDMFEEACRLLAEKDLPLSPSAPGGMVEYRRSLTLSFFFKFYLFVSSELYERKILSKKIEDNYITAIEDVKKPELSSSQLFQVDPDVNGNPTPAGKPMVHSSAFEQTTGEAVYVDDIPRYEDELYLALVYSRKAHARILNVDPSVAIKVPGVEFFLSAKDLSKKANTTGVSNILDEEVFASKEVTCQGQAIGAIVAKNQMIAQKAARLVTVEYEDLPVIISIEDAIEKESFFDVCDSICNGNVEDSLCSSDHVAEGELKIGGQEHFYLETQACLAVPKNEHCEMEIFSSSQNPALTQRLAAMALETSSNRVVARIKRLGGGFGGKETRCHVLSTSCALAAKRSGKPVRGMYDRDEDMASTGTRHPVLYKYKVGFDSNGKFRVLDIKIYINAGNSLDLSVAVLHRALFHCENSYKIPVIRCTGKLCRTNIPSNTAFRGFGGPQGMFAAETIADLVASILHKSPEQIREMNLYKEAESTHYNQILDNCTMNRCWKECLERSNFYERKQQFEKFNSKNRWKKRGISVIPTKFGISFTAKFLNQSGALVHVYTDGSVLVSHGGVEMGQGLHVKMIQVAATTFNIDPKLIYISETSTDKVPNTSPTAASVGSDLNGMAVKNACEIILERLVPYREKNPHKDWKEWVNSAYFDRVSLSSTGFYKIPNIGYSFDNNCGNPFNYFTYGAACSEVEIDCLTGDHQVLSTEIVMDLGKSLNPTIDIGQIEGGFVQGYGLFILEELNYSPSGFLYTRGPGMYKIPSFGDVPAKFNVSLLANANNTRAVFSSKAVGEPPLFLASSVFFAIKDAIKSARKDCGIDGYFRFDSPATAEKIRLFCYDNFTKQFPPAVKGSYTPWAVSP